MPDRTPPTHYLFLRIIGVLGQSTKPMIEDLSTALNTPSDVVAQCIALHLYFEKQRVAQVPMPLPVDYWVPTGADVITSQMLRPKQARRMLASSERKRGAHRRSCFGRASA
jgi:hypothetical protein